VTITRRSLHLGDIDHWHIRHNGITVMLVIVDHLDRRDTIIISIELRRKRHHSPRRTVRDDTDTPVVEPFFELSVKQRQLHDVLAEHPVRREEEGHFQLKLLPLHECPVRCRVDRTDHANEVRRGVRQIVLLKAQNRRK